MIGERLGHYLVEAQLGAGGMGIVYRAHDTLLDRIVAIKLLRDSAGTAADLPRILHEARSASRLNHPNICTVYEVCETPRSPFIVFEFVEGRPLGDLIPPTGLPVDTLLRYATQVADALAHAHEQGIVHRDLKGSNVIVTSAGRVKLLDFGLARRIAPEVERVTRSHASMVDAGEVAGTLAYMPPEVLRAEPADARSDVWMLGVLMYEMAAGELPFKGRTPFELSSAILREAPAPLPSRISASLGALVTRCLMKAREQRYRRAGEVLAVLDAIGEELREPARGARSAVRAGGDSGRWATTRAVAVLPFRDLASDPAHAHLGLGLADATITELALVKSLLVRPTSAIMQYQDRQIDALSAARELAVDAVVVGGFQRAGPRLRVTVQLVSASDGRSLWATKVDTSLDDIFQLQDEVSRQIARALEVELSGADEARLERSAQPVGEAYEQYMKGRLNLVRESLEGVNSAIECFERARQIDAGFAPAYVGLADAYLRLAFTFDPDSDWYARGQEMCRRALALDPQLPEGRYLRGRMSWCPDGGFDHASALAELVAAAAARPSLNEAHHWLGIVLFHVSLFAESARRLERAMAIAPDDMVALMHLGFCHYLQGDYQRALQISEQAARREPSAWICYQTALAYIQLGNLDEAVRTTEFALRRYPGEVLCYPLRGLIAARRGDADRAQREIELTTKNEKAFGHYHHAQYDVACIYAQLGRRDEALGWLGDAAHNGFPCHRFFEHDPLLEPVRQDGRFSQLMVDLRHECDGYRKLYDRLREGSTSG